MGALPISSLQPTGRTAVAVSIFLLILCVLAVITRLCTRYFTRVAFAAEDFIITLALFGFSAYVGVFIRGIQTSGGTLDTSQLTPEDYENLFKYNYTIEILFTINITLVKTSILLFLRTVFSTPRFRQIALVLWSLCILWFIAFLFVTIFQCHPVEALWDQQLILEGRGSCLAFTHWLIPYEATNIALDVAILSLPIWMVRNLQMTTGRKLALVLVFCLGGFVCVTGCVRLSYLAQLEDIKKTQILARVLDWTTVELATAIICACLPTYGPLFLRAKPLLSRKSAPTDESRSNVKANQYSSYYNLQSSNDDIEHLTPKFGSRAQNEPPRDGVQSFPLREYEVSRNDSNV